MGDENGRVDRVGGGGKGRGVAAYLHLLFFLPPFLLSLTMFRGVIPRALRTV
jgi:hypothetical protein